MTLVDAIIMLLAAAGTSALATPMASRLAHLFDVVDRPNGRKVNTRADIPLLGGLAVAFGAVMGLAAASLVLGEETLAPQRLEGILIGGTLLLVLGAVDDRHGLGAWTKLAVQILAAVVAVQYGFEIPHLTEPLTRTTLQIPGWASWLITIVWIVGVTNAVNLIDGLDGLASGLGAIIAGTLVVICWQAGQMVGVVYGIALFGALLGFLPFNFPPARIFLGDTGALFIGFSLSLLAIEGARQPAILTFVVPLLALAVPLLDTALSIVRRLREGRPVFSADRAHMHHRLLEFEGSDRQAVLSLYFLTICFCVIAVSFTRLQGYAAIVFLCAVAVLTLRLLRNLEVLNSDTFENGPSESIQGNEVEEP
ncbi:MAG: glycosyltransferase family 4 protein [Myxococcota bacterium]